ncbi:DUF4329 domain-containing protein [Pontivivens insulae]|uniref:DUF4329 domain-containing protein n=1 Tax=Pontivivens insulae TaxID=1639689 RepID=A0A2R8A730_9RHOB|nr:DUF4329 domain-containing protein [Pontivivens insulae]RED18156.1 uncharacterized protein DUF4329 [Pontivivens insulae]SPF28053.1 hypothetical protein POI8812_00351 [Pontivivens insulae]
MLRYALVTTLVALTGCAAPQQSAAPQPTVPAATFQSTEDARVQQVARDILSSVQTRSIRISREICGYVGRTPTGQIVASTPTVGEPSSCFADEPPLDWELLASYHTHGSYDWDYDSEVPSIDDMIGDLEEGVDAYIATPGGRFWHIDLETERAYVVCGIGCLPADPNFIDDDTLDPVPASLTLPDLYARFDEG